MVGDTHLKEFFCARGVGSRPVPLHVPLSLDFREVRLWALSWVFEGRKRLRLASSEASQET